MCLRSAWSRIIRRRDTGVRKISNMDKRMRKVRQTMDACGCITDLWNDRNVGIVQDVSDERDSTTTRVLKLLTSTAPKETVTRTSTEQANCNELGKVDEHDHEYVKQCDVPQNHGVGRGLNCNVHGRYTVGNSEKANLEQINVQNKLQGCANCTRNGILVDKVENKMFKIIDEVRCLNEKIIQYAKEIARMEDNKYTHSA